MSIFAPGRTTRVAKTSKLGRYCELVRKARSALGITGLRAVSGDSGEGKKNDEYREVNGVEDDGIPKQSEDVFVDQDITSRPKPRLLPSIQQRMRGWRRRKSSHLQEMSPREARPLHVA